MLLDALSIYALVIAVVVIVGETLIVIRTNKYWPLSLDDYVVSGLLIYSALTLELYLSQLVMLLAWALMSGNLYAMLFTRMEPGRGSRERLGVLTVLLLFAVSGAGLTLKLIL